MKYIVQMTALAVVFREVEITATSEKEAMKKAIDQHGESEHGWEIDCRYKDGRKACKPSASIRKDD